MKQHQYRITLEHLTDAKGAASQYQQPLIFNAGNHDDIFVIVEKIKSRGDLSQEAATALGVGLKLFSEVMLDNKDHPLFETFRPHFLDFMKELKKGIQ